MDDFNRMPHNVTPQTPPAIAAQPRNPLHGITLEAIVTALVTHYSWKELGQRIPVRCFISDPSVSSRDILNNSAAPVLHG